MNEEAAMTTIRMRRCGDPTLDGYIFTDWEHARAWLTQPFVKPDEVQLEEVQTGPWMPCPRCRGSGSRQDVKTIRKVTFEEVSG